MARIKLDGDAAGLLAAQRKVRDSAKEMDREFDKVLQTNKDLERQVKRTWEQARSPLERYNEKVRRLHDLHRQQKIDQDQLNFSLQRLRQSYERTEKAGKRAFGATALAEIGRYAAGIGLISVGVNQARQALQDMEDIRLRSAADLRTTSTGIGSLASLTEDPAQLNSLIQSMDAARKQGLETQQAAGLVFQLQSAGRLNDRNLQLIAQGAATGMIQDPTATTESLATVVNNLGGTIEDTLDLMSAGASATKATPVQFLQAMTSAAQQAKTMGINREDLAAMVTVVTGTSKRPDIGGTQVEAFLAQVERARTRGLDIQGTTSDELIKSVQDLMQTQGLSAFEVLSEKEAVRGFRALVDRQESLAGARESISRGIESDTYNKRLQNLLQNQIVQTEIRNRQLTQQRAIVEQEQGLLKLRQENAMIERQILDQRLGEGVFQRRGARVAQQAFSFLGADEETVAAAGTAGARAGDIPLDAAAAGAFGGPGQLATGVLRALESIDRKTREPAPSAGGTRAEN